MKALVAGRDGGFAAASPARYGDGISVTVTSIRHAAEDGHGAGTFAGRHYTAITFLLRNGSARTLDLADVVITTTYGLAATPAEPVYSDEAAVDFTGAVPAGGVARATYLYAIPPDDLDNVDLAIDLDGDHAVTILHGRMSR